MKQIKNSLVVFAGVIAIAGVVMLSIPSRTQGMPDGTTKQPSGAFSVFTEFQNSTVVSGPNPAGTNYAVSSFTVTNHTGSLATAQLNVIWSNTNDCSSPFLQTPGPRVSVAAGETVHLSFPQPFVFSAESATSSCLRIIGSANSTLSPAVVGYRF